MCLGCSFAVPLLFLSFFCFSVLWFTITYGSKLKGGIATRLSKMHMIAGLKGGPA